MSHDIQSLLQRFQHARNQRHLFRSLLDVAYQFAIPNRNLFDSDTVGAIKNFRVFDTTLVRATNIFVSKLVDGITPPFQRWAKLIAGEEVPLNRKNRLNAQLEGATDLLFRFIHRSNFALAIGEAYSDLAIGTMSLLENPGPNDDHPLVFEAVPLKFLAPEEGSFGTIESSWRELNGISGRNVLKTWPKAKLTSTMKDAINDNPDITFDFIEGSIELEPDKFLYIVINKNEQVSIFEEESESSAWIIGRWRRLAGEVFGRGPVIDALPSALTLNKIGEFELKAAALEIAPPFMAYSDSVFNPHMFRMEPNAIIPVERSASPTWPLQKLDVNGNVKFGQFLASDLRAQINALLFTEPLGPLDTPVKSATEVNIRNQELVMEVGPAIGRLEVEVLSKIIKRTIFLLKKRGLFPDIEVDGKQITLSFESPLAKSQDSQDLNALVQTNELIQALMQNPQALAAYNLPQIPEFIAEKTGLDLSLVKTPAQVIETAQQAQQLAQQQQLQQMAQQQAANQPQGPQAPRQIPAQRTTTGIGG